MSAAGRSNCAPRPTRGGKKPTRSSEVTSSAPKHDAPTLVSAPVKNQAQVEQAQQHTRRQVIEQTEQRKTANRDTTAAHRSEDRRACEEGTPGTTR